MSTVSLKLVLKTSGDEEVLRLPFQAPVTMEAVKAAAAKQWPASLGASLSYSDADGDTVLLSSDEGLAEALLHHSGPILKIFIAPSGSRGACAHLRVFLVM